MKQEMDDMMKRLRVIYDDCVPEEKKEIKSDEFTKLKKKISKEIREVREQLKKRDDLLEMGGNSKETSEISQSVRTMLKAIREEVDALNSLQKKEAKKTKKMSSEVKEAVATRAEIVELCYKHIEECEKWEKRLINDKRNEERSTLMSGGTPGYEAGVYGYGEEEEPLVEIDDYTDQLQDLKNRNKDIDKELEDIAKGMEVLKEIAINMNEELETQNQMIDQIQTKVDKAGAKLETLNAKLQNTLDKVMKGDRFLITFILICVLLMIIGFIASMFA